MIELVFLLLIGAVVGLGLTFMLRIWRGDWD